MGYGVHKQSAFRMALTTHHSISPYRPLRSCLCRACNETLTHDLKNCLFPVSRQSSRRLVFLPRLNSLIQRGQRNRQGEQRNGVALAQGPFAPRSRGWVRDKKGVTTRGWTRSVDLWPRANCGLRYSDSIWYAGQPRAQNKT